MFQKAFAEFWCKDVGELEKRIKAAGGWVTWYAANAEVGRFEHAPNDSVIFPIGQNSDESD